MQREAENEKAARHLYGRFSGHNPGSTKIVDTDDDDKVYLNLGRMDAILYTTTRDGERESYKHTFKPNSRPQVLVSHDGKHIRTIGGRFTFTERGFVDENGNGEPIE